ncbi:hypothetical protein DAPPUDRAFT_115878 [Daphnia pulex]|uniref:Uncharacterized protein n=1 Tax=Daphnia pulex TaxID=6669 RepID=E9HMU3_DAPPU|nr:hypothetical protein DAPPUDRAFT_115878 [Daphnia pulex]|eukprot:EFX66925.1 hypothetical protein DAPPUDRAFT_115878 [Daphnia pulex]
MEVRCDYKPDKKAIKTDSSPADVLPCLAESQTREGMRLHRLEHKIPSQLLADSIPQFFHMVILGLVRLRLIPLKDLFQAASNAKGEKPHFRKKGLKKPPAYLHDL